MSCSTCGKPAMAGAKFCSGCGAAVYSAAYVPVEQPLVRPLDDRKVAGVCAGIALRYGWDVTLVRLAFVLAVFCGFSGVLIYVIAWIVMPNATYAMPPVLPPTYPGATAQ